MDSTLTKFEELRALRLSVSKLCRLHVNSLNLFHPTENLAKIQREKVKVFAFSHLFPNSNDKSKIVSKRKISIASTVTCIKSLCGSPEFSPKDNVDFSELIEGLTEELKNGEITSSDLPHGNPFTVGLLLPILKTIGVSSTSLLVRKCIQFAKKSTTKGGISIDTFPPNGYLAYWILKGLEDWGVSIEDEAAETLGWSRTEFYRQIGLFSSNTDEESDAFQLGYNLLIQYKYSRNELRDTVVKLGLKTLFDAQLSRGIWEKKDPLFVYGRGGDAYCFSFELLTALLTEFLAQNDLDTLAEHEGNFSRSLSWIQRNVNSEYIKYPMWRSGHRVNDKRPESWATAEIYLFLQLYRSFLSQRIQKLLLNHFKGDEKTTTNPKAFAEYYLPSIRLPKENKEQQLDELLIERILEPLRVQGTIYPEYSLIRNLESKRRIRSGILFGPPGTGKTTFVKAIARYLGWPLIILDPSDFAKDGMHLITTTTTRVFELLMELEDTVVFFDEMEELIRDRKGETGSFEQKFLITSLLPKLQSLHDRANCLFFVATNHFEDIDPAARREGRFDFQIQVVPPSFKEKVRMVKDRWKAAVPNIVKRELDRRKESIEWATRAEMLTLIDNLMRNSSETREIIEGFSPVLLEGENRDKYLGDSKNNLFQVM